MILAIEGMHCQKCVERVRKAIESVRGARAERVDLGSATVLMEPYQSPQVIAAVRAAGYEAREAREANTGDRV
jgi:copper chaperone CopZ